LRSTTYETFNADAVIVTIPLGSLKRNAITFTPPLPLRIQNAISSLGYGVLERLFVRFSQSWWLTPPNDPATIAVDFFRFPSLKSTMEHLPRGTLNFFSLARTHNPQSILGIFASTELAKFLASLSKDDLKTILQTYYIPKLPNYNAENSFCQIMEVDCSSWSHNVFSGFGSYSHIPVGSEHGVDDMMILSEKILDAEKGGIWFAGEHTAKVEIIEGLRYINMATVTGAYQSGVRAANNVLSLFT
jgi:Flavin containing amine oxidoreductase